MPIRHIYLDNNATTRTDPRVVEAMLPYFSDYFGNAASSGHSFGWSAAEAVETARVQVASLIGAEPREIVFTSGATESDNLAIRGIAEAYRVKGRHVITSAIEHKAVLDTLKNLTGLDTTILAVDKEGRVDVDELAASMTDQTVLVSVMLGNNEIGTIQDIAAIGALCHERGVLFHTDATQGVGKVPVDVDAMNIDLLSMSGHKMYGPKGVGALYVRRRDPRVVLAPQMTGGGHESGRRSGTLNTPGIVGLGKAAELCATELALDMSNTGNLRDMLERKLLSVEGAHRNGHSTYRLPNTLNIRFDGVDAEAVIAAVPDVAMSASSACSSASITPSHVLRAIGLTDAEASTSLRLSTSRFTTVDEIDYATGRIIDAVTNRRRM